MTTDVHPMRYPKHDDPEKGQVLGGVCNTTACDNENAVYYNQATRGLYCPFCGRHHNWQHHKPDLSIQVTVKPTIQEMDQMFDDIGKAMEAAGGW